MIVIWPCVCDINQSVSQEFLIGQASVIKPIGVTMTYDC